ncbi:hypothetical protein U1Q18_008423 [Sarracenia purpurea var. burkii]
MPPLVAARPYLGSQLAGFFLDRRKLLNLFSSQSPDLTPVAPQISTRRRPPSNNKNQRRCFYRISPAPKLCCFLEPPSTCKLRRKPPPIKENPLPPPETFFYQNPLTRFPPESSSLDLAKNPFPSIPLVAMPNKP